MSKGKSLVVKKVKKVTGGGHHGGAWKVAYADFVTAMMAFFLLLWLISMVAPEKRARVSAYFKNFSIYDQGGSSFMDKSNEIFNESGEASQKAFREMYSSIAKMKRIEEELKAGLMKELGDAREQVLIDTVDGGVRIQMTDKEGSLMFELGSNKMTPKAKEILRIISENIKNLPNKIAIEGHTDSLQYSGNDYSNWELSTERASSARKELEAGGLHHERIIRVSGFADKEPLISDDPSDPRNRRISIILKAPFINDSIPHQGSEENAVNKKDVLPARKKNEGKIMVEKFEENLSLIKTGMNAVQKDIQESELREKSKEASAGLKDKEKPESKNWGPVIQKNEWSPVIKDELKPAITGGIQIDKTESGAAPSEKQVEARPRNMQIPAITKDTFIPQAEDSVTTKKKDARFEIKKETPAKSQETAREPAIIKEFQAPVLSKDILGPLISK